jgi:Fur family iron response transcriptional regulator
MNNNTHFEEKLRSVGLRPTKQRLKMCEILFDTKKTFHFTIEDLRKILKKKLDIKISQATIYNTINAFKNKGYVKEISLNSDKTYFDTNVTNHHHFYNETTNELIDFHDKDVEEIKLRKNLPGKKIKSIEVLVKVSNK